MATVSFMFVRGTRLNDRNAAGYRGHAKGRFWPVSAPFDAADRPPLHINLYLGLFGHLERVIDLNAEVADGALQPMSRGT